MNKQRNTMDEPVGNNTVNPAGIVQVGDVVQTNEPFGPNPAGSVGVIYEIYADMGTQARPVVSVLLVNGHDIGSFTGADQDECLTWLGRVSLDYTYVNPSRLMQDFREGYFQQVFAAAVEINRQQLGAAMVAE